MVNTKSKLVSLLMALIVVLGTMCAFSASADAKTAPKRTIMVYAVGSNLESDHKCFTNKIVEFSNSPYNENLDMIVITGGATKWHANAEYLDGADEIDAEYDQVWKAVGKKDGEEHGFLKLVEPTGMPGYEKASMGLNETLTAFMDYCYLNYPADIYDIILWDHGGGPIGGYGLDDRFNQIIWLPQLVSAFEDSKLINDGKKFELMDFDACLMSNVTVVAALGSFADYLIVSPEVEYDPAQRHHGMLDALRDDPSISGFELGKILADDFAEYFNEHGYPATLAVIDTGNFKERMLPLVLELDGILISEAEKAGNKNGRYNFYDEMYSLLYSLSYDNGEDSVYDFGTFVGALSVPMSEMDNISSDERDKFENAYTDVAKRILAVLSDSDGSGDDVLYFRCSDHIRRTVGAGVIRGANGELIYADENGKTVVTPTGLSIFFADKNQYLSSVFVARNRGLLDSGLAEEEKEFFKARLTTTAYYGLIFDMGYYVSRFSARGEKNLTFTDLKKKLEDSGYWEYNCAPLIDWLIEAGEFADADEAEEYLTKVVAQQCSESISAEKIKVRPIKSGDGSFDSYQVTVSDSSAQVLMGVEAAMNVTYAGGDSPEYLGYFKHVYGDVSLDDLYPEGMTLDLASDKGDLDLALYYNSANDTLSELYERIYSSPTSVWTLQKMKEERLVMFDLDGGKHLIDLHYVDESREYAYMPLSLYDPETGLYYYGNLILQYTQGEWTIKGLSCEKEDLFAFVLTPSDEFFDGLIVSPCASLTDVIYEYTSMIPIGNYFPIDVTKDNWGLSLGMAKLSEIDNVVSFRTSYAISTVYGTSITFNTYFENADKAAERGDFVRDISFTDVTVSDAVFTGLEASPDVTVTYDGKTLVKGVDYKVLYDGSSDPGSASLTVWGIGDFCGTLDLTYTIRDSVAVKVDGAEIGEDQYTVDEDTGAVTLTEEFLKTLAPGDHTLTVILSGAETTTDFTVPASNHQGNTSVPTGDGGHTGLWILLMTVSAGGAIYLVLLDRKRREAGKNK